MGLKLFVKIILRFVDGQNTVLDKSIWDNDRVGINHDSSIKDTEIDDFSFIVDTVSV